MSQVTADFCKTEVVHWSYTSENAIFHCQDYKSKHTTGTIPVPSNNQSDPHHTLNHGQCWEWAKTGYPRTPQSEQDHWWFSCKGLGEWPSLKGILIKNIFWKADCKKLSKSIPKELSLHIGFVNSNVSHRSDPSLENSHHHPLEFQCKNSTHVDSDRTGYRAQYTFIFYL